MSFSKITLVNGLTVINFSSPHVFKFDDGSVLPACDKGWSDRYSLDKSDISVKSACGRFDVASVSFGMYKDTRNMLISACKSADIVIIPLPMLDIVLDNGFRFDKCQNAYTCFLVDRVNKIVSSTKFCR